MTKNFRSALWVMAVAASVASCKKDDADLDPAVKAYTVPATYTFSNASYTKATAVSKMATELDTYLKLANAGSTVVALDQTKITNMWNNTGNPFSDASLNTAGANLKDLASDAATLKVLLIVLHFIIRVQLQRKVLVVSSQEVPTKLSLDHADWNMARDF